MKGNDPRDIFQIDVSIYVPWLMKRFDQSYRLPSHVIEEDMRPIRIPDLSERTGHDLLSYERRAARRNRAIDVISKMLATSLYYAVEQGDKE